MIICIVNDYGKYCTDDDGNDNEEFFNKICFTKFCLKNKYFVGHTVCIIVG